MKVVVAIDSFKGSLTSIEAGMAAKEGILKAHPDADVIVKPLADGGEGTTDALIAGLGGERIDLTVTGPFGTPVNAHYGYLAEKNTAIIEMAAAAGIILVKESEKNPLTATTYGVGEMIADAMERGIRNFIIGIGGSATNDGGIGMLKALGYQFSDENGQDAGEGGQALNRVASIVTDKANPLLKECSFRIACDVTNTLCGEQGCSAIFGPQKGATPTMILQMDKWLAYYATLAREIFPHANPKAAGSGAAGGLGFAFMTFLNGTLESGIKIVLEETRLSDYIKDADIVVTGEGRLDGQTVMGKAPIGVAKIAKQFDKPVLAFSGCVTKDATACNREGIDAFFPVLRNVVSLEDAMNPANARQNMADTAEQVFRTIRTFSSL